MTIYMVRSLIIMISMLFTGQDINSDKKPVVKASELKEWISYLASVEMRGRANGSPEMRAAAEWIVSKFKRPE